jgi:hypothetical protein
MLAGGPIRQPWFDELTMVLECAACACDLVLSLSKDGSRMTAVLGQAQHGVGAVL